MARVVVPAHAGLFSALGCAVTDVAYDHVQTFRGLLERLQAADLETRFAPLADAVAAPLLAEGHARPAIQLDRSVDVRYVGQNYELEVPWRGDLEGLRLEFQALHQRLYGYATGDAVECVNLRVRASVPVAAARFPEWPGIGPVAAVGEQRAYFAEIGEVALPVYRRADLAPEHPLKGPALIEDPWATTLVYPGQTGSLDRYGNLVIEMRT